MRRPLTWLLVFIAASAMSPSAAAESLNAVIAGGEQAVARMHKADAKIKKLQQRSEALSKVAAAIDEERSRLRGKISGNKTQIKKLQKESKQYELNCFGFYKPSGCPKMLKRLNREINETNAKHEPLKARRKALKKEFAQYNAATQKFNQALPGALKEHKDAYAAEQAWLNKAIDLITSKAFLPYIPRLKAAGCPSPSTPVTSAATMKKMAEQMLDCLRKFAQTRPPG